MRERKAWFISRHDPELKRLCDGKLTVAEIALLMGFDERTIKRRAAALRIQLPRGRPSAHCRDTEIRERLQNGASVEALAIEYGLSQKRIRNIKTGISGKKEQG